MDNSRSSSEPQGVVEREGFRKVRFWKQFWGVPGDVSDGVSASSDEQHRQAEPLSTLKRSATHPGGNPWANPKSISHRCYLREVAFEWGLTEETIYLHLGCLQGGTIP